MPDVSVRLTCEQCKKRKVKCDKLSPCSSCRNGGFYCQPVQRARLPRGRTGNAVKRNGSLAEKVARLERMLEAVEKNVHDDNIAINRGISESSCALDNAQVSRKSSKIETLVAPNFWITLSNEVSGLREMLEVSDSEGEPAISPNLSDHAEDRAIQTSSSTVLFSSLSVYPYRNNATTRITSSMREKLLGRYRVAVDPIFKVLHWPSIVKMLQQEELSKIASNQALTYAIFFVAVCSTTQVDCDGFGLGSRHQLVNSLRSRTENALSSCCLLTTTEVPVLQAFILYLVGLRCCMQAHEAWTLLPLAVRVAETCGVRDRVASTSNSFEIEQCRRIWFSIGLLDSHTAFGRASLPLLSHEELVSLPRNINDNELSTAGVATVSVVSFTDMTHSHLCYTAMTCQRRLCDPRINLWQDRVDLVSAFEVEVHRYFGQFEYSDVPIQRYTATGAKDMSATMNLLLRRPPYKYRGPIEAGSQDFDIMRTASKALQSGLFKQTHPDFAAFKWFSWPKWYILAVLLVELLDAKATSAYARALEIARRSYTQYAQSASEATSSLLWKPISKLMRRVEARQNIPNRLQSQDTNGGFLDDFAQANIIDSLDQSMLIDSDVYLNGVPITDFNDTHEAEIFDWNNFLDQMDGSWDTT